MTRIEGRTSFARSPEQMFDFLADPRNEPAYNPRIRSARKLTPGAIGPGTRYVQHAKSFGRVGDVTIVLVDYQRPRRLSWDIQSAGMSVRGDVRFDPRAAGCRVSWAWDLHPKGAWRLLGPLMGLAGRRMERRVWQRMQRYVDAMPATRPLTDATARDAATNRERPRSVGRAP